MKLSLTKNVSTLFRGSLSDAFKQKMEDCLFEIFLTQVGPLPSPWLQPPYPDPKREGLKKKTFLFPALRFGQVPHSAWRRTVKKKIINVTLWMDYTPLSKIGAKRSYSCCHGNEICHFPSMQIFTNGNRTSNSNCHNRQHSSQNHLMKRVANNVEVIFV